VRALARLARRVTATQLRARLEALAARAWRGGSADETKARAQTAATCIHFISKLPARGS
jgi:hypothetical protein